MMIEEKDYDIAIIGGGINGASVARYAAKLGYKVILLEKQDLAQGTSSASTKLIHGGLRYLEHYEFRLVRESLLEREVMWQSAPHIIYPMRFILPHHDKLRPKWLIRLGLFLYDHIGGRKLLPTCRRVKLNQGMHRDILQPHISDGFEYSDCWVDDARLVVINAMDAQHHGALIKTRHEVTQAEKQDDSWRLHIHNHRDNTQQNIHAKLVINAGGPWVSKILNNLLLNNQQQTIKLIKGSHIIVKKIFDHDHAYILQHDDKRIVFAIPYEHDFTLIGTTDIEINESSIDDCAISHDEVGYLCDLINQYFQHHITPDDLVASFAGIRPLYDDGDKDAQKLSRDYVIDIKDELSLVNIFGGKITTSRALAEEVMEKILPLLAHKNNNKISKYDKLIGGDFDVWDFDQKLTELKQDFAFLSDQHAYRLMRNYGTKAWNILGKAKNITDLGIGFGYDLYENEVIYLIEHEFALSADDILYRRSKLYLHFDNTQKQQLDDYMSSYLNQESAA